MAGRLLFDENLSPKLAVEMEPMFPGSSHVRDLQLKGATDQKIWCYAGDHGFTILAKDDDFRGLSLLKGAPPKVIWLVIGITSTAEILQILTENSQAIEAFIAEPTTSLLTLRKF